MSNASRHGKDAAEAVEDVEDDHESEDHQSDSEV